MDTDEEGFAVEANFTQKVSQAPQFYPCPLVSIRGEQLHAPVDLPDLDWFSKVISEGGASRAAAGPARESAGGSIHSPDA